MSTEEEVRELERRLVEGDASEAPDTSAIFEELLDDDVLFVTAEGTRAGSKGFVVDAHRAPKRRRFSQVTVHDLVVRVYGETVAVACRTDFTASGRTFSMQTVRLWRKRSTGWKVVLVTVIGTG